MTHGVYVTKAEIVPLAKTQEPSVCSVGVLRLAVPLDEQAVGFYPLAAEVSAFFVLFGFVRFK